MKLNYQGLKDTAAWAKAGIELPPYDAEALARATVADPRWAHFGIGNIFRIFVGSIADRLLRAGLMDRGITCVETFDYDVVDKIYTPYDNLALAVIRDPAWQSEMSAALEPIARANDREIVWRTMQRG